MSRLAVTPRWYPVPSQRSWCWPARTATSARAGTRVDHELALVRVLAGKVALGPAECPGLIPDPARDAGPPYVVEVPGKPDGPDLVREPEAGDRSRREFGDSGRVAVQPRALQVDQVAEGAGHLLGSVIVDMADRVRFRIEHALVGVELVDPFEQLGGPAYKNLAQMGVEQVARLAAHCHYRGFVARVQGEEDRRRCHVHHAGAHRDRLTCLGREARAVPSGDGVEEAGLHRLREADSSGRVAGHLAGRHGCGRTHPPAGRGRRGEDPGAGPPGRLGQSRDPGPPHVRRCAEVGEEGQPDRRDVVTPDLGCLVGVRGAAEVLQQRGVDDVADLAVRASRCTRKALRDEAPLERFLQRRTGTHVSRDRQPAQQRKQAEHTATVPQPRLAVTWR